MTTDLFDKCKKCNLYRNTTPNRNCEEIERKFLITNLSDLNTLCGVEVLQGYIISSDDMEVRLRKEDGCKYSLTIKNGGTLVRKEYEISLTKEQFDVLWPTTENRIIEKIRYCIPYNEYIVELSVYIGRLEGLMIAEIEFPSIEKANLFEPPVWFGTDITLDTLYKNKNLAIP
jgi:CYTH domain-containing protein